MTHTLFTQVQCFDYYEYWWVCIFKGYIFMMHLFKNVLKYIVNNCNKKLCEDQWNIP